MNKYPKEWNNQLRDSIRKRDGYCCIDCGISEKEINEQFKDGRKMRYRSLEVHHVDYNILNTKKENLISLCHRCHGKTKAHCFYDKSWNNKTKTMTIIKRNREYWTNHYIDILRWVYGIQ